MSVVYKNTSLGMANAPVMQNKRSAVKHLTIEKRFFGRPASFL
jgi:hypothetical protein